jgi:hypothetical protein
MHTSDVTRLEKLKTALLLAAFDMDQAAAAARALRSEAHDVPLMHALESAIAVCYSRAFSQSTLVRLTDGHKPIAPADVELHEFLVERRNKAYAHTDRKSGRAASVRVVGDAGALELKFQWLAFPRERIQPVVDLCERQKERFLSEAVAIQAQLDAAAAP